ncbi:Tim10/DDP family zinc finger-domain-containing protein, partial [Lasiosphaeria miniovina]
MDSDSVKKAVIRQILTESDMANARQLIDKIDQNCFEKCVPKPGSSLSSGEKTCVTQCMDKYMAAWNAVNATYMKKLQEAVGH